MKHLAIFKGNEAESILSGKQAVEVRFSKRKDLPFGQIASGDLVYIKPSGKEIIGQFKVKKVIFYDGLSTDDILEIKNKYRAQLPEVAKYVTLIFIGDSSRFLTSPIKIRKKDSRTWVVLG